ncbi:MAG TPA: dihydroorotate dehydrogenase-like protein [Blastocatellia bacterium]|nr:dihydroorotate dehydrogenase-like protein [Blastocatellia bacterium]
MDLSTEYIGLKLKNPIVPSSSPLSHTVDSIKRLEDAGASAVVMYSLFEEQINSESYYLDYYLGQGIDSFSESLSYFPEMAGYNIGPDDYVDLIRKAKQAVDIPIIGSLNGISSGGWIDYACLIEEAGADALELNVYYIPTTIDLTGSEVENIYVEILRDVKRVVQIPVAMKLSPFFSSTAHMANRLAQAGANALVMFNRFYQPDFDLENLEVAPNLVLSGSDELRLSLRWVAILYGQIDADLAITSGIHTCPDVLKALMAGARVAMMASELLQNGVQRIGEILREMLNWMEEREYSSVEQMIGSMSQRRVVEPAAFVRANYMKTLASYRRIR